MIDFHSHILPAMDDGAEGVDMSLKMLALSKSQGVSTIVSTSHFYAYDESPEDFLERRTDAYNTLLSAQSKYSSSSFPKVVLGAEVLFYPGMSGTASLKGLKMGNTSSIMIEPPMHTWDTGMLDEISRLSDNLRLVPIIAHVDRYMRIFDDNTLIDMVLKRKFLVQVNTSFFLNEDTTGFAIECLKEGKIHLLGTDCHNLSSRAPNFSKCCDVIREYGCAAEFSSLVEKEMAFLR